MYSCGQNFFSALDLNKFPKNLKIECNYSAAIHQDGEKPVLFVPYFFRELLGFLPLKQGHTE
jgi:hypothetical protein